MKLEEVLPAMREGRVAINRYGIRHRLVSGMYQWWYSDNPQWISCTSLDCDDGWTLEPEPKVEWPKGSLVWACEQAGPTGFVKRSFWQQRRISAESIGEIGIESARALDWEVVP